MKLLIISHKETWENPSSGSGYSTTGGFPFQIDAISHLFEETVLLVPIRHSPLPTGVSPITGRALSVAPLVEPRGVGLTRKLSMFYWIPRYFPFIWRAISKTDAVHAPVPGDIGLIGILISIIQGKRLFIRHCGTWGVKQTITDHFLFWLLERVAGERNLVLATGGSELQPSKKNPHIHWIFSTTLNERDLGSIPQASMWQPGKRLTIAFVARLTPEKNLRALLQALPILKKEFPDVKLLVAGDGSDRPFLSQLTKELKITENVNFLGNISHEDVLKVLARSHLFIFPTKVNEGFPKAVVEAMACGLPIIASQVSVIPQLIVNCGRLLKNLEPSTIAEEINLILRDSQKLDQFGSNARLKAQNYSIEKWQILIKNELKLAWDNFKD